MTCTTALTSLNGPGLGSSHQRWNEEAPFPDGGAPLNLAWGRLKRDSQLTAANLHGPVGLGWFCRLRRLRRFPSLGQGPIDPGTY